MSAPIFRRNVNFLNNSVSIHVFKSFQRLSSAEINKEVYDRLVRHAAPYQNLTHEEQLRKLHRKAEFGLKKISNILINNLAGENGEWKERLREFDGLPCELLPIRPSPVIEGYRNKDDVPIGPGVDGTPDIGLYIPPGKFPNMAVCGYKLKMQNEKHHRIAQCFREVITRSDIPAHGLSLLLGGHWRSLFVRSNRRGETMVNVSVSPRTDDTSLVQRARDIVNEYFVHGEGARLGVDSVFFSECEGYRNYRMLTPIITHLHGPPHLTERLHGNVFRVSPTSFFQLNTLGAEELYSVVRELAGLRAGTVLMDVCCGTGTIGILYSKDVAKVLAIEQVEAAVEDAKINAEINGCTNIKFFCGAAEKLVNKILETHTETGDDIVAIVNPGRGGLGGKVTRALRRCEAIRRIVYVSCNPQGRADHNFVELCRPSDDRYRGDPFVPMCAVPVDMFPTTNHVELVVKLQR